MKADRDGQGHGRMPELRVNSDSRPVQQQRPTQQAQPERAAPRLSSNPGEISGEPRLTQPRPASQRPTQPGPVQAGPTQPRAGEPRLGQQQAQRPHQPRIGQAGQSQLPLLRNDREEGEPRYRRGEREVHTLRRRRRVYAFRRFMPPVLVFVLGMFCAFLWSSGAASSIFSSVTDFVLGQSVKAGLVVENVSIQGREKLSEAELREALGITKGTPIFAVDPEEARARVSSVGWVKTAAVTRELPNTIKVVITERTPAALWQRDGALTLIDGDGHPITSHDLAAYNSLPQVVGKGAEAAAADLIKMVQTEPTLAPHVKAAVRVGERRWDVVFKSGVRARLPEQDVASAWTRLAALEREHRLLEREIHIIDLRQADRLVLRLTDPEVTRRKELNESKLKGARV